MPSLDLAAMTRRFKDRAQAVRNRPMPPIAGAERLRFIKQAETDFTDFAMVGDAEASLHDGILTLSVDLRPQHEDPRGSAGTPGLPLSG